MLSEMFMKMNEKVAKPVLHAVAMARTQRRAKTLGPQTHSLAKHKRTDGHTQTSKADAGAGAARCWRTVGSTASCFGWLETTCV